MIRRQFTNLLFVGLLFYVSSARAQNWAAQAPPYGRPDATIDLRTGEGAQLVHGQWRYNDAKIVEVESKGPGADLKPSGLSVKTYDYSPHAGAENFDDSQWPVIDAKTLDARRGNGKVSFNWYRINVTLPERVASFSVAGSTVSFEIVIDDYAEIWVNGKLPSVLGQSGGSVVKGWNNNNVIYRWSADEGVSVYRTHSGYSGDGHRRIWATRLERAYARRRWPVDDQ